MYYIEKYNFNENIFTEYLKVSVFSEENFISINLENPYALKLFDSIFNKLYINKIVIQSSELDSVVQDCIDDSNQSLFNMCRCDKCYDIMDIQLNLRNNFDSLSQITIKIINLL